MTRLISSNGQKFNNMDMFSCMDMTHKNHYRPVPLHRKSAKFIPDINLMLSFHSDIGKCNVGLLQQIVSFVLLVGQDFPDAAVLPFGPPVSVRHAVRHQVP